jgi:hypothetical protein
MFKLGNSRLSCILLALTVHMTSAVFGQEMSNVSTSNWGRFTRGFRQDHNFSVSTGITTARWHVDKFGTISEQEFLRTGYYGKFQYSFHIPIVKPLGVMLGSSVGYLQEQFDDSDGFQPAPAHHLPGLAIGLIGNLTPVMRPGLALEYYLERWGGMKDADRIGEDPRVHITVETVDLSAFIDMFYAISWAIRIEYHQRRNFYPKPKNRTGFPVDATFSRSDSWIGLGTTYHLL